MRVFKSTIGILLAVVLICGCFTLQISASEVVTDDVAYQTYMYDYFGNAVITPNAYTPASVMTGEELGIGAMTAPSDIVVDKNNNLYIVDTGYDPVVHKTVMVETDDGEAVESTEKSEHVGRVVVLDSNNKVLLQIYEFNNGGKKDGFKEPKGVGVAPDGTIYVCDSGHGRIVRFDSKGNYIQEYGDPKLTLEDQEDYTYTPTKVDIDDSGNMFVVAKGVNMGVILLDCYGVFSGYVGAQQVSYNVVDYVWKTILSEEQQARMDSFVPTEYNNIVVDEEGFVFATTSSIDSMDTFSEISGRTFQSKYSPIKRLNPTGDDVLVRRGYFSTVGDIEFLMNSNGEYETSVIVDVALGPSGRYTLLDTRNNRLFTYSQDGELLYTFGSEGLQAGSSIVPVSICYRGSDLLLLDSNTKAITTYSITQYGKLIDEAYKCYSDYNYDDSVEYWQQVLHENANFDIAYDGIGNSLIRTEQYKKAMEQFRYSNNKDRYSVALAGYRTQVIEKYLLLILLIAVVIIVLLVKLFQWIGKRNRSEKYKNKREGFLNSFLYSFYIMVHPFDGFWDLKHEKRGNAKCASVIVLVLTAVSLGSKFFTNYLFNPSYGLDISIIQEVAVVVLPFLLWTLANWSVTTLANGEGKMVDIYKFTGYALMPMIICTILNVILSHFLIADEQMYITFFTSLGYVWSGFLIFSGNTQTHRYTVAKSIGSIILTIVGMCVIVFVILVVFYTYQRVYNFIDTLVTEVTYRL